MSTEDQRAAMLETLSQASEWMFEEGDGAETKVREGVGCHNNIVLTAIMFHRRLLHAFHTLQVWIDQRNFGKLL